MYVLAFLRVGSGKWAIELGQGGDGKSKCWFLERGLFGQHNTNTLDLGCLFDRGEFRKSAHFVWGKACFRIQEGDRSRRIVPDIWKRMPEGEVFDLRANYGLTSKRSFEEPMGIHET
eukprot:8392727-Karenia_brevis.AAC.1